MSWTDRKWTYVLLDLDNLHFRCCCELGWCHPAFVGDIVRSNMDNFWSGDSQKIAGLAVVIALMDFDFRFWKYQALPVNLNVTEDNVELYLRIPGSPGRSRLGWCLKSGWTRRSGCHPCTTGFWPWVWLEPNRLIRIGLPAPTLAPLGGFCQHFPEALSL